MTVSRLEYIIEGGDRNDDLNTIYIEGGDRNEGFNTLIYRGVTEMTISTVYT